MLNALLMLALLTGVSEPSRSGLTLVVDEYPPYIEQNTTGQGLMTQLVMQAYAQQGIYPKLVFSNWRRIEEIEIDQNHYMSFPYIHSQARNAKWHFSDNIITAPTAMVHRKNNPIEWRTLEDLKPYTIGISAGYHYGDAFEAFRSQLNVYQAGTDLQNLRRVIHGRLDIFPVDPYVATALLNQHFSYKQRMLVSITSQPSLITDSMHAVCAKTDPHCLYYLNRLNRGLEKMKQNGQYQALTNKALSLVNRPEPQIHEQ